MLARMALRDALIVLVAAGLWHYAAPATAGDGWLADLLGFLVGFAVIGACYVGHEWGHLTGALATGSAVETPQSLGSFYLFSFDSKRNSRRQFLAMSFAGFAMTGAALGVVYGLLPGELLATRVARGGVLFLSSLAVFIEFPLVIWSLVRSDLPPVETFASHRKAQKAAMKG